MCVFFFINFYIYRLYYNLHEPSAACLSAFGFNIGYGSISISYIALHKQCKTFQVSQTTKATIVQYHGIILFSI